MTGLVLTIDDNNPLINYEPLGAWSQHNGDTDAVANNFYGRTYTQTKQAGATMSFTFEGVGVAVYGSKNVDHGNYSINLDGNLGFGTGQGTAREPVQYQSRIFITNTLPGTHTLTLMSQHSGVFDIDYITWTSKIDQNKNSTLVRQIVDDADPAFDYSTNPWSTTPSNLSSFHSSTGHSASKFGSSFNFTFEVSLVLDLRRTPLNRDPGIYRCIGLILSICEGDAVSLFGTIGPKNGPYTVQLDDQPPKPYIATKLTYTAQTLLYYGSNIGAGNHTLRVVNQADALLEIDYAEVYTLPIFLSTSTNPTPTSVTVASDITHKGSR
ncbi:hypothetical protein D9615_003297 [Tricholomella constricta]|uniref:Uncharacterized protein n=1 Tax=Tricholomella constricta TaxID=117010 RepID=A0A8H5M7N5_9AGAR|nr:hypothetical protein D9615_003297 [Tricholomella constricta]